MKYIHPIIILFVSVTIMSCTATRQFPNWPEYPRENKPPVVIYDDPNHMPPGQAKKVYGKRNAKYYAPGWCSVHRRNYQYRPEQIIIVSLGDAFRDNRGQWFYDDDMGYRYWMHDDGRFYLDSRYNNQPCFCNLSGFGNDRDYRNERNDNCRGWGHDKRRRESHHEHRGRHEHHDDRDDD